MITLDGSAGEGGGQVLRTALSLSLITGRPFRIERVRAGRSEPGLRRQHRTAVRAAAAVGDAEVAGDDLGSREVTFRPGRTRPGEYRFDTGGAGSAILVLQTLLPPLVDCDAGSRVAVDGGTHNPAAPPFEFADRAWAPLLRRTDADVQLGLERAGFHPGGGGRVVAQVGRDSPSRPLELASRGRLIAVRARSHVVGLPSHVAQRELATAQAMLEIRDEHREAVAHDSRPGGPANVFLLEVESESVTEVFTEHGRRGLPAEEVAARASRRAREYLRSGAAVWSHLADQLLLPLSIGAGGRLRTCRPSSHASTNARVVEAFLDVEIRAAEREDQPWEIRVSGDDRA